MSDVRERRVHCDGVEVLVVEAGDPSAPPVLFLHGWPESAYAWRGVMAEAAVDHHAIAVDLPGVGGSTTMPTDGSKDAVAARIRQVVDVLELVGLTLVGHDIGGMVAYSYLRKYADLRAAVIMNVFIPGINPADRVLANPALWHIGFHRVPGLAEGLVTGRQRIYFEHLYKFAADPTAISESARSAYAGTYWTEAALAAGFDWYRTLAVDAERNAAEPPNRSPLLFLRGELEPGPMQPYVDGFERAGVHDLDHGLIAGAGHFLPEEAPAATWRRISEFLAQHAT
jgi:pimeloyl-ACP methyl ester carboxylesterase